jgi:class 3 adenylate cyclase
VRVVGLDEPGPLPDDPVLAATAEALNATGQWATVYDSAWRWVYMTDETRRIYGGRTHLAPYPLGVHWLSREGVETMLGWSAGQWPMEYIRTVARARLPVMLGDANGDRDGLRELVDPRLHDILDEADAVTVPTGWSHDFQGIYTGAGALAMVRVASLRLREGSGKVVGNVDIMKTAVGMSTLARITGLGDQLHFERLERVAKPERRAAAILFADLESSSALARRLATGSFFAVVRRIARVADQVIIDAGGLAGQHAGDGVVGFFLASESGSESAAARACIAAARALRDALPAVAAKSDLDAGDLTLRFGLHWGSNLYVGQIATGARTEVTALGDQVNETARIEACATGGRTLASKDLVERLASGDAAALGIDPDHMTYRTLADLDSPTGKARRDAPALAVCEI